MNFNLKKKLGEKTLIGACWMKLKSRKFTVCVKKISIKLDS